MKKNLPVYVLATAVVLAGLVVGGVPATALLVLLLLVGCPLMMFFMMRGMGGMGHGGHGPGEDHRHGSDNDSSGPPVARG